jgi:hypothetical protein
MDMKQMSRAERFIAAFNDIEDEFRRVLDPEKHVKFLEMARTYADQHHLPSVQRDGLQTFATLRNAISHGRWHDGQPIAEPNEATVREIEKLRDQITSPPKAVRFLPEGPVCTASPDDPISTVLKHVVDSDYSQIPVYDGTRYIGILTTNAVARWVAYRLEHGHVIPPGAEPVGHVLAFAEAYERALFVNSTLTAAEAIDQLTHGGEGQTPVTALIITQDGQQSEKPVGIITSSDLPALSAALGIGPS